MDSDAIAAIKEHWEGDRWRLWAFTAGMILVLLNLIVAALVGMLSSQRAIPLALLFLVIEIFAVSLIGSGLLESVSGKMNRGGLAREASDLAERTASAHDTEEREERNRALKDRKTIRSGLFVLPLVVAFIVLLPQA